MSKHEMSHEDMSKQEINENMQKHTDRTKRSKKRKGRKFKSIKGILKGKRNKIDKLKDRIKEEKRIQYEEENGRWDKQNIYGQ